MELNPALSALIAGGAFRIGGCQPNPTQQLAMEIFQGSGQLVMSLITLSLQAILYSGGSKLSAAAVHIPSSFNKSSFPQDFVFGGSSSAYQYEGAANEGGRGASIWDTFTHKHPEKIMDHSTGDVANDFYHRYEEDIDRLKDIGMDAFRLSISWSRILPRGKISGGINREGIKFYNNVFNKLITQGIKPYVTLFHWDVPQALEDEYEGFLHENIVNDFQDYADLCFKEFGDKVKYWTTINEPVALAVKGYDSGEFAPGRCSSYVGDCPKGNSATEPYIVAHNQLLAHAAAVNLYKHKYQASQKGEIGITLVTNWYKPKTRSAADLRASLTSLDFNLGWYLHPLTYGDYPSTMRKHVGKRLPKFTKRQAQMVKGSMNFLGINYYTTNYVSPQLSVVNTANLTFETDTRVHFSTDKNGIPICKPTSLDWIFDCPSGIRELMLYIKNKYNNPTTYVFENGMADKDNGTLSIEEATKDMARINYHRGHLWHLQEAIREGANVKGYFPWSFLDDFEWIAGHTSRFGIYYVDYKDGLKRYPKLSAFWFKKFLRK